MENHKLHLVLNPMAAGGKTRKLIPKIISMIENHFGKQFSKCFIKEELDAMHSTKEALKKGCDLVVVAGGDGTLQNTLNGFIENERLINPQCKLGIINSGTGGGFAQSIGLPTKISEQIELIATGKTKAVDIGKISYINGSHNEEYRFFLNECQVGIGGVLVRDMNEKYKKLGGLLAFGL